MNQLVLRTLLHQLGLDPHVVEDGAAAVAAWESMDWDLILMDVQMPVMDGLIATGRIREIEAAMGRARTPIVSLTANAMAQDVARSLEAGCDRHLTKPIRPAALFEAIESVVAPADPACSSAA